MTALRALAARPLAHIHALWGPYWFLPLLPAVYGAVLASIGGLRPEYIVLALAVAALGYGSRLTKRFVAVAFPALLVALAYDSLRYVQQAVVTPQTTLTCQVRNVELALFRVAPNVTLQDYFAVHHTPLFDVFFAVPYGIFLYVIVAYAAWLTIFDERRGRQYIWAIAVAYLLAMGIWFVLPAAPPWYVQSHGCAIDNTVIGSAAGLLRVDRMLGIPWFESYYARTPAVFAAFPSMHCAFPMIGLLVSWRKATALTRPIHCLYTASMFAGSIYLDHHWTLDGLGGWALAAIGAFAAAKLVRSPPGGKRLDPDPIVAS